MIVVDMPEDDAEGYIGHERWLGFIADDDFDQDGIWRNQVDAWVPGRMTYLQRYGKAPTM